MSSAARPLRRWDRPRYSAKETGIALLLLAPSIAVFVVFFFRPFLNLLYWGTFESRANGAFFEKVGLRQYREQLTSDDFREGLWHSVEFVLSTAGCRGSRLSRPSSRPRWPARRRSRR